MSTPLRRRAFVIGSACLAGIGRARSKAPRTVGIVTAPSGLGLRPNRGRAGTRHVARA